MSSGLKKLQQQVKKLEQSSVQQGVEQDLIYVVNTLSQGTVILKRVVLLMRQAC